jgi:hypothetical protein
VADTKRIATFAFPVKLTQSRVVIQQTDLKAHLGRIDGPVLDIGVADRNLRDVQIIGVKVAPVVIDCQGAERTGYGYLAECGWCLYNYSELLQVLLYPGQQVLIITHTLFERADDKLISGI